MEGTQRTLRQGTTFGVIGLLFTVVLAASVRLIDPLSTWVLPQVDPYTHMGVTRESLRLGAIESNYPAGIYGIMAALHVFTGTDLYALFRFSPVLFGSLGVLGMGILLWRHLGPLAAFAGSLGYALAPEIIHRTTMMAPTAIDLGLTPFFLFAVLEVIRGHLRWAPVAGAILWFFVFAHPWFLGLLILCLGLFVLAVLLSSYFRMDEARLSPQGITLSVALVGTGLGYGMTDCGGLCGPNLKEFLPAFLHSPWAPYLVAGVSLVPLLLVLLHPERARKLFSRRASRPMPIWGKALVGAVIGAVGAGITLRAVQQGMPASVDVTGMFGWPILLLGALGGTLVPLFPSRIALLGASITAVCYPLFVLDPYGHEFLPRRMAAFFGIGLVILLAVAAVAIARVCHIAARRFIQAAKGRPSPHFTLGAVPMLLVVASLGGTVYTATPEHDGWYRMYNECEAEAFEEISALLNQDPDALIITGSWQAYIILIGSTEGTERVWVGHWWMRDYVGNHEATLERQEEKGSPLYILIDGYTYNEVHPGELWFLEEEPWQQAGAWCHHQEHGTALELYTSGRPQGP